MVNVFDWIRRGLCGVRGHDGMVRFEHDRMFLKCFSCGYESPGWTIGCESATTPSSPDDLSEPLGLGRRPFADAHRIA